MEKDKIAPGPDQADARELPSEPRKAAPEPVEIKGIALIWEKLIRLGLGEMTLRVVTSVVAVTLFLIVVWIMSHYYLKAEANITPASTGQMSSGLMASMSTATPEALDVLPTFSTPASSLNDQGIYRFASLHTILPSRPRYTVTTYTVETGDTVYGIAEKFGLEPKTILWGNEDTLGQNPELIVPGQVLNILPVDGAIHKWSAGEGLNAVAKFFDVTVEDIINYPGNNLDPATIGDYANPNIAVGTELIIPGGKGEFSDWKTPIISRENPAVASVLGAGYCGEIYYGAIGTGTFIWPSTMHFISGYNYDPGINHYAIDIGGAIGNSIFAADTGVVVYAGWNDWGYGNMIVIDHGNGWQTLYAHLSVVGVSCGQSVYQGDTIGQMGSTGNSTGPHLHFEMRSATYGRVNPLDYMS
jgi:murein DD-endopeptidase MepM/ murein hydrolase activator NlpD